MGLKEDLIKEVATIFREQWTVRDGQKVPVPEDLRLGNDAVKLDGTVLYADMADSTGLVDRYHPTFAAEVYKSYLTCAARIIKDNGGSITAYDGDRIMAVFIGDSKNSSAAKTGLKINWAVHNIINPAIRLQYPNETYKAAHTVGVDTSSLFIARIGVRNDNDLVWVGRAANYAAKLTAISETNTVFITNDVFSMLNDEAKYGGNPRQLMWRERQWTQMGNRTIHSSTWSWEV
jgi:class 3 adenylate cyclase